MKKISFGVFLFFLFCIIVDASPVELPAVSHYSLQLRLFPKEERFEAVAKLTIANNTNQSFSEIPFLLYRLLSVQSVSGDNSALEFKQTVTRFSDEGRGNLQVNLVEIKLSKPLAPGATTEITINYGGSIYGYSEVWGYVKDRISEQYSLLRPDAFAYPMLARASRETLRNAYAGTFTYELSITVPAGFVAVCGGAQQSVSTKDDLTTFIYKSKIPTWRIDIAAAKFKQRNDPQKKLSVYFLPEDEKTAADVMNGVAKAVALYSNLYGEINNYQGYTVIEIPDGWGSQASDFYLLQAAASFKDVKRIVEVYHEVAHSWNAKSKIEVRDTRWFDEAFAMYFQAIALREFEGETAFQNEMDRDRERFISSVSRDNRNLDTPIADYSKQDLGGTSYSKGAWSLYVLNQLVGEEVFRQIVRAFISEFGNKPANFQDFKQVAERVSHRDLSKYFNEWIYGSVSSQLLMDKVPVGEIVRRY